MRCAYAMHALVPCPSHTLPSSSSAYPSLLWQLPAWRLQNAQICSLIEREIIKSTWMEFMCEPKIASKKKKRDRKWAEKKPKNQAKILSWSMVCRRWLRSRGLCRCVCLSACLCVRVSVCVCVSVFKCVIKATLAGCQQATVRSQLAACRARVKASNKKKYCKNTKENTNCKNMLKFVLIASLLVSVALAAPVSEYYTKYTL